RDGFRSESGQVQPELFEDFSVEEASFGVEPLVRTGDGNLRPDDPGACDAEDPLQVLLGPERAEPARARADDGNRLVAEYSLQPGARRPVDRVLEPARDRAVVLGRREEDRGGRCPVLAQAAYRIGRVGLEVLVIERQLADSPPELELDAVGRGLERS